MQPILPQLPEVGKIYAPKEHPEARIKVKEVLAYAKLTESSSEVSFMVTCCDPDDSAETVDCEFIGDEWQNEQFTLASEAKAGSGKKCCKIRRT